MGHRNWAKVCILSLMLLIQLFGIMIYVDHPYDLESPPIAMQNGCQLPRSLVPPVLQASASSYTSRGQIVILSDSGFTSTNGVVSGSGTSADPYVIEGWEINLTGIQPPGVGPRAGIEIKNTQKTFVIRDVYIHADGVLWGGIRFENMANGTIEGSIIEYCQEGISVGHSRNITVSDCLVDHCTSPVYLYYVSKSSLVGNNLSDAGSDMSIGIDVFSSDNCTIARNNASRCWIGIYMSEIVDSTVSSNTIYSATAGINCQANIMRTNFTENNIFDCSLGINLWTNTYWTYVDGQFVAVDSTVIERGGFFNNTIWNCTGSGILVESDSPRQFPISNLTFTGNNISGCGPAVVVEQAWNLTVMDNNLSLNGAGIKLFGCGAAHVYHNSLLYNAEQAFDDNETNDWDSGYPDGGNYWSDYNGTDLMSGSDQDLPGSDGLGDIPYSLWPGVVDRYPFAVTKNPADTETPNTSSAYDGLWHTSDFFVPLSASDTGMGVAETFYSLNSGPVKQLRAEGQPLIATENSNNTLVYWSLDLAGNEESPRESLADIKLDKTPPAGAITIDYGFSYTNSRNLSLGLQAIDEVSGVRQMRLSYDNSTWSAWESYNFTKSLIYSGAEGKITVFVQYKNGADLVSIYNDSTVLDVTPPVAYAGSYLTVDEDVLLTINGSSSSDVNGIIWYFWWVMEINRVLNEYGASNSTINYTFSTPGTYSVVFGVEDPAGNIGYGNVTVLVIDKTPPEPGFAILKTGDSGQPFLFDASGSKDNGVIVSYLWDFGDHKTGSGETVSHTYHRSGTYHVNLTVVDSGGNSASATRVVHVQSSLIPWVVLGVPVVVAAAAIAYALIQKRGERPPKTP